MGEHAQAGAKGSESAIAVPTPQADLQQRSFDDTDLAASESPASSVSAAPVPPPHSGSASGHSFSHIKVQADHPIQPTVTMGQVDFDDDPLQLLPQLQCQGEGDRPMPSPSLEHRLATQSGSGSPLSPDARAFMEPRFGFDFSQVRIHTDGEAVQMNRELSAQAFTHGHDVYFNAGNYDPHSASGQELLAHELTHVIQQTGNIQAKLLLSQDKILDFAPPSAAQNPKSYPLSSSGKGINAVIQRDETNPPPSSSADPGAIADQIYDALNWLNNETQLFQSLQGHDAGLRSQIQQQFQSRHGQSLQSYLKDQLEGDSLVRAFALLTSTNYHEQHTAMALALIPLGTRDEEIFRILYSLPESGRRTLEEKYNATFSEIGEGSLKLDLKDDLSGWRKEKSLALLHHNLTSAEELYFDSVGITGTHTDAVVNRIQSEWDRGPSTFAQFERDWDQYVKGSGDWNDQTPWTSMTLAQAMQDELSGEEWELVQAVLTGHQHYHDDVGVETGPLTEAQQSQREDIELQVAESTLTAATTGGYTGWGTNEPQVFRAVSAIRRIWQQRIERARQANDTVHLQEYQQAWEQRRQSLLQFIPSEMDEGTADNQRVQLLTVGDLTPADEVYLASQDLDSDRVISLITRYWAQGQIDSLIQQSQTPRTDANGSVLRPSFDVTFTVPVTSGITASRLYTLTRQDKSNVERGALRLHLELEEGDSDSDLQRAYQLMSGNEISGTLRDGVIQQFATSYLSETDGDTPARKFLTYISNRYENSTACWNFRDLLDRSTDPHELVRRAEGRLAASHTGILDAVLDDYVRDYDELTGEDTQAVTQESLERLRFIAAHSDASPDELQAMMAMSGAETPQALANMEYSAFQSRLEELRQLKRTIADAIATVVELTIEAAITIATGGAAAGAFIASLSATIAGMLLREAMLGQDYDLLSRQNAQQLVLAIASHGFNAIGRGVFADIITPERLQQLGRAGGFLEGAATEAFTQLNIQILTAGFEGRAPSVESISASVLSIAGSALGAGTGRALSHGVDEVTPAATRLRTSVISNITQNVISGVTEEGAALVREGTGNLSGADIAARLGSRTAQSVGRGLSSGISEFGGHEVSSGRSPHPDTDTEPGTSTPTSHPDETSTAPPPHSDGAPATTPHPDETSSTIPHPDETGHTPPPEPRSLPSDDTIPDVTPHPTSDEEPTIPDGRSPDLDDEPTIPNGRVPTDTTPSHPLTSGHDAYPEGLVHYGLTAEDAHSSYRVSLEEDPSREAGIWMDPTNGEHIVVQGGADFVSTGWSRDPDFANRPWRLVEHFHPGDDVGARFASVNDFASMMHPQLSGQAEPGPISTRVRWRDAESHIEFVTEIGYAPGQSEPYWIRYRDAHGEWQTQRFSDTPWNAGSDYIRFLQTQGIPQPTIPGRIAGPALPGDGTSSDSSTPNTSHPEPSSDVPPNPHPTVEGDTASSTTGHSDSESTSTTVPISVSTFEELQVRHSLSQEQLNLMRERGTDLVALDQLLSRGMSADDVALLAASHGTPGVSLAERLLASGRTSAEVLEIVQGSAARGNLNLLADRFESGAATIIGHPDYPHELPQAIHLVNREGGGEFSFATGRYGQGIEGTFTPTGSSDAIPVSLKAFTTPRAANLISEIERNASKVRAVAGEGTTILFAYSSLRAEDLMAAVTPAPGMEEVRMSSETVFRKMTFICEDGTVQWDARSGWRIE